MSDPMDDFLIRKAQENYERARKSYYEGKPRRGFWDAFWDIPYIHAILITLLVLGWASFVFCIRLWFHV